ncbi:bifunctional diguanylate cyclase/phosphodiesterase [Shewanella cyperi]|uniref:bifunctional diguanylate cyclase/phosphodiesterase n=1 Tax=Shewanella cyperi TaxID=2814292 RepID=UPI001A94C1BC|nr:bifunctional diguanylate cyclase/phosphodiesterase [Shewanella cyperi]QSX41299.1 EAL domain-containing protein [Shewanella cyperi]
MSESFRVGLKTYLLPLILSLLTFFVGTRFIDLQTTLWSRDQADILEALAEQQAINIKQQIDSALISLEILSDQVKKNPDISREEFEVVAKTVVSSIKILSNVQLARNGVVSYIYPLAGNEAAIGHNLLMDDNRRADVLKAINSRSLVLSGPYKTVQGPIALIARLPIFIGEGQGKGFWGFATAMIHLDRFETKVGISNLVESGFLYRITTKVSEREFAFGDRIAPELVSFSREIHINNNGVWTLTVASKGSSNLFAIRMAYGALIIICMLIFYINFQLFRRPSRLISKLDSATKELARLEYNDERSGLPNLHYFTDMFNKNKSNKESRHVGGLLLIKIDNFKMLRSVFSSESLRHVYQDIASVLTTITRKSDLIAQVGEDSFVIYIDNFTSLNDVWICANKISKLLNKQLSFDDRIFQQHCLVGICLFGQDGTDPDHLLKRANIAIDVGVQSNSNINFFSHEMESQFLQMMELEMQLEKATAEEEFILHYQPQVDIETMQIKGFEALIRWQKQPNEVIYPNVFISAIERMGLINTIGYSIIKQACQAQAIFTNVLGRNVGMSINLSPSQFVDPNLFAVIKENILSIGSPPNCFTFEITESLFVDNSANVMDTLNKLRGFGVHIALDDFGTGYSSFNVLRTLPITELKIDKSFVDNVTLNPVDEGITTTIIKLAKDLNMKVVAEGIETTTQHEFMKTHNCNLGQGYLYSKPVSLDKALELLYQEREHRPHRLGVDPMPQSI